jgi:hypothetical protein
MTELRGALLDPVGRAGAAPQVLLEDLSERVRTARPMARTESGRPPRTHTTLRASAGSFGAAPAGPSRERHQRRAWLGIVGVALAGVALAVGIPRLHHAGPKLSAVPARSPAVIRVTFGSDPTGAEVFAEGDRMVGTTPLWIELPANERPARYVFRKAGFSPKTMSIIPDISVPLFAILEPARGPQALAVAATPSAAPARAHHARLVGAVRRRVRLSNEDDILTPSFR